MSGNGDQVSRMSRVGCSMIEEQWKLLEGNDGGEREKRVVLQKVGNLLGEGRKW